MEQNPNAINVNDIPEFYAEFETDDRGFNKVWINPTQVAGLHPIPNAENKTLIELNNGRSYNVTYDCKLVSQLLARCWMNLLTFEGQTHVSQSSGVLAGSSVKEGQTPTRSGR